MNAAQPHPYPPRRELTLAEIIREKQPDSEYRLTDFADLNPFESDEEIDEFILAVGPHDRGRPYRWPSESHIRRLCLDVRDRADPVG